MRVSVSLIVTYEQLYVVSKMEFNELEVLYFDQPEYFSALTRVLLQGIVSARIDLPNIHYHTRAVKLIDKP